MPEIVEKLKPFSGTAKGIVRRLFRHENAVLMAGLIALIGGMQVFTKGKAIGMLNIQNVLVQSTTRGIAAIGQAFVLLSGGIDISVGGMGMLCSVVGALVMTEGEQNILGYSVGFPAGILIMLLVGAGIGAINGLTVSRIGMPAIIVTLGVWMITKGLGFLITGGRSVPFLPDGLAFLGSGRVGGVAVPILIFVLVTAVAYFVLYYTTFGRSVYAVGGNPVSSWLCGMNVKNIRLFVFTISGFLAALAGVVMTARVMSASVQTLMGLEIDSIASVCIGGLSLAGGKGSLIGVILGVLMIGIINNGLSLVGADPATQGMVKGFIIIAAVAVDYLRRRG